MIYHRSTPTVPSSTLSEGRPLTNPESTTLGAQPWCVFILGQQSVPFCWASLMAHLGKNLPAMQKTWVRSLGWEDPLEKGTATQPTPVFWPGEFHGLYSPWGRKESDMTE